MAFVQRLNKHAQTARKEINPLIPRRTSVWQCRTRQSTADFKEQRSARGQTYSASAAHRGSAAVTPLANGPELDLTKMEPLGDRILVKPAEESTTSEGGLILSPSTTSGFGIQDAVIGEVVAVGSEVDIKVKKGDTIAFSKYSTSDVSVPDGEVTFVAQKSVLATLS